MPALSKKVKSEVARNQTEAARNLSEAITISAKVILEEGLYIALMADLWIVSGRIKIYEDGTTDKTLWATQREIMGDTLYNIELAAGIEIPFTNFKPLGWAYHFIHSWKDLIRETEVVDGVNYYKKLDTSIRMIMVFMLPGILRTFLNLTRQLIQVIK